MPCAHCGHPEPIIIDITDQHSASPLRLISCTKCEVRTWEDRSGGTDRALVLQHLSRRPDFVLVPPSSAPRRRRGAPARDRT